jgi:hypothetical protein
MAYEVDLQAIADAMQEPAVHLTSQPGSPEQMMEERVARLADEMIDISMLALDPEQKPLVEREWRCISQILLRAQLMLSVFRGEDVEAIRRLIVALDICKQPHSAGLRIVRNG